ncbi:phosphoribosyltransferase [bacterium]|nr:phosphoribosyltransferase [bacterium]
MSRSLILNHHAIGLKLDRIAWQIAEEHFGKKEIIMVGLKDRGLQVAEMIYAKLQKITEAQVTLTSIEIDKSAPLSKSPVWTDQPKLSGKSVVLVDDVLNSGITLSGVLIEVLKHKPKSVKVAVLANRDHKAFPVEADFVGISLATTLKEHLSFVVENKEMSIYLD